MKTAISLPDAVFEQAEKLARHLKTSRSDLYARALTEYLARHAPDEVTAALNNVAAATDTRLDKPVRRAAIKRLRDSEW
jgi:predicted transcriptional regulator